MFRLLIAIKVTFERTLKGLGNFVRYQNIHKAGGTCILGSNVTDALIEDSIFKPKVIVIKASSKPSPKKLDGSQQSSLWLYVSRTANDGDIDYDSGTERYLVGQREPPTRITLSQHRMFDPIMYQSFEANDHIHNTMRIISKLLTK
jgi:hypothetical protein